MAIIICRTHTYSCTHTYTIHGDQFVPLFTESAALETLMLCLSTILNDITWRLPSQTNDVRMRAPSVRMSNIVQHVVDSLARIGIHMNPRIWLLIV